MEDGRHDAVARAEADGGEDQAGDDGAGEAKAKALDDYTGQQTGDGADQEKNQQLLIVISEIPLLRDQSL